MNGTFAFLLYASCLTSSPITNAQAIPSANSDVPIKLLFERSFFWNVKLQSSIDRTSTFDLGKAEQYSKALDNPAAPPAQPNPQIGILFICALNGKRLIILASILGVDNPVVEIKNKASISSKEISSLRK